jgi:8-oxo-dGTP pyrophosphatase MutT (NUDIX family)
MNRKNSSFLKKTSIYKYMRTEKVIAAGIIPIHPPSGRVLMILRGMNQPEPNTWAFFGGKFEDEDINPKVTAKREFKEESGIDSIKFRISTEPIYVNDSNHLRFYNYVGLFDEQFVPDLEKEDEAKDYGWFSLDNLPHNMHPGVVELLENKISTIKYLIDYYS